MAWRQKSLIDASNAEINIQQLVYLLVVFPIAGLFFPAITFYWDIYAFLTLSAQFGWLKESVHIYILNAWGPCISIAILAGIVFYTVILVKNAKYGYSQRDDRRLKPIPGIEKGAQLLSVVERIWQGIGNGKAVPQVLWFFNFNVLARATGIGQKQIIEISNGLWERVVKNDWLAEFILAHEIAHLTHGDIIRFRQIDVLTFAVRRVVRLLLWISGAALLLAWTYELFSGIKEHQSLQLIFIHLAGAPVVALFVLLPLVVGGWVIRRYGGFITSLMELRADITANEWFKLTGLFKDHPDSDPTIHQSTIIELGHSLVSLNLTHISESERFNILKSSDRLLSPKLRYFALSLFLALLIPLNSFTPMLSDGAIDHLFIAATIIALHVITFAMLLNSPSGLNLSPRRSAIIALALYLATGLATINAYQFGYYLTEFGASFFAPNGFADNLLDWPLLARDFNLSLGGIAGEFANAYHLLVAIPAIVFSTILIYFASNMLSKAGRRLSWLGLILICVAALLAVYDPARKDWYPEFLVVPASWLTEIPHASDIRYILPSLVLFIYSAIVYRSKSKIQLNV